MIMVVGYIILYNCQHLSHIIYLHLVLLRNPVICKLYPLLADGGMINLNYQCDLIKKCLGDMICKK